MPDCKKVQCSVALTCHPSKNNEKSTYFVF
jgi:hypothetical protein